MSLASRLVNIFVPNQASHLVPSGGQATIAVTDGANNTADALFEDHREGHRKETWVMEEEEEEERPPYVHASHPSTTAVFSIEYYMLTRWVVYVSWGYRRNYRRPPDALYRYSQDPSAGRPTYPFKIYLHVWHLC